MRNLPLQTEEAFAPDFIDILHWDLSCVVPAVLNSIIAATATVERSAVLACEVTFFPVKPFRHQRKKPSTPKHAVKDSDAESVNFSVSSDETLPSQHKKGEKGSNLQCWHLIASHGDPNALDAKMRRCQGFFHGPPPVAAQFCPWLTFSKQMILAQPLFAHNGTNVAAHISEMQSLFIHRRRSHRLGRFTAFMTSTSQVIGDRRGTYEEGRKSK